MKNWIKRLLSGIAIGVGAAIPGVSGGTIAIIFKVYETIINAVSNIFKKFKESFLILLPVVIGVVAALIPCVLLMNIAFKYLLFAVVTLFAGFIIGSFPSLLDEVKHDKVTTKNILIGVTCLLIALAIGILSFFFGEKINLSEQIAHPNWWMYLVVIPVGVLASSALVVPGISGSMLMLILGFYKPFIDGASEFLKGAGNWSIVGILGCFAVGVIIGFYLISKLMGYLLTKHRLATFYGIIGFIIGSLITLYINHDIGQYYQSWGALPMWGEMIVAVVFLLIGVGIAYLLVRYQRKQQVNTTTEQ